ncbi:MAG: SRPBCC domain-containing protein [Sphingobacteriaceae bacterium]|nr:SRPBCC domain-containing protein [Sphingobacteriaceae bacterium]
MQPQTEILNNPDSLITSTRVFNFNQTLVFKAWTTPEYLKKWWGPKDFTNTFHEFDLRPGGKWVFTMHAPEQGNFNNEVEFIKIEEPNIIWWNRISQPWFQVYTTFETVEGNKTKVIFNMVFDTQEARDKLIKFVPEKNEENFDRLEVVLKEMSLL